MRKIIPILMACALTGAALTGCGSAGSETPAISTDSESSESSAGSEPSESSAGTAVSTDAADASQQEGETTDKTVLRIGALKGPTSMGLVSLMDQSDASPNQYQFTMASAADELTAGIAGKDLDIALVPANVASVLYSKTNGGVSVIDINTLGVLYVVSGDTSIQTPEDLSGKTIYMTGKGTTPDYVMHYILEAQDTPVTDVAFEYKSEPAEVAAVLKENPDAIGLLPQPFATVACAQNDKLSQVMDLTEQWDLLQGGSGSRLVTGVTIVRNDFLKEHEDAVKEFMAEHRLSAQAASDDPERVANLVVEAGIIEKAPIAQKALPYCSITYIDGQEMKDALSGYLNVLFSQDPASVGGSLPADDFYYMAQ